jgi:hypothetical protein
MGFWGDLAEQGRSNRPNYGACWLSGLIRRRYNNCRRFRRPTFERFQTSQVLDLREYFMQLHWAASYLRRSKRNAAEATGTS